MILRHRRLYHNGNLVHRVWKEAGRKLTVTTYEMPKGKLEPYLVIPG